MKRLIIFIVSSLVTPLIMAQGRGSINGIYYSWGDGRATVEKQSESIQNLTANIPDTIKDYLEVITTYVVDSIVDEAFRGSNLQYLSMPKTIRKMDYACFAGCDRLLNAHIPDSLISIGDNCFYGCKRLKNLNFPVTLKSIGDSCFYNCTSLKEVILGNDVKHIGNACFAKSTAINTLKIYSNIDTLYECTFEGCSALSQILWPKNIQHLGNGCFAGCSSLSNLHLPSSLISIGDTCFSNCTGLTKVYCPWKNLDGITISQDAFKNLPTSVILFVPKGCAGLYLNSTPWNKFLHIEEYECTDTSLVKSIDLGLSVKWASCNVGVSVPSGYGDNLSWGEWYPKDTYSWSSYIYCKDGNWYGGIIDIGSDISDTEYDVVHGTWGGDWRMPTKKEAEELVNNCKWDWSFNDGIPGMIVTGYNGNSIFLPATGDYSTAGKYWTSSVSDYSWQYATSLYFNNLKSGIGSDYRCSGLFVRPVTKQNNLTKYISIKVLGSGKASFGCVDIVNGIKGFNVEHGYNPTIDFHPKDKEWVVKLIVNGENVTQNIIDGHYALNDEPDSTIIIAEFSNSVAPSDAVDLGLSVLWAKCNLGADIPEAPGEKYAWGTTHVVPNNDWYDYICSEYSCGTISDPIYAAGLFDSMDISGSEFDQAHVLLGAGWKLPSNEDFLELIDNCDWTRETVNGINGFKITGKNGNSIFLPDNGYGMPGGHGYSDYNGGGFYWSSTIASKTKGGTLHFVAPNSKSIYSNVRCYNQHIRPVYKLTDSSTGIVEHKIFKDRNIKRYYNINGTEKLRPSSGLNIIRSSNGRSYKLVVK